MDDQNFWCQARLFLSPNESPSESSSAAILRRVVPGVITLLVFPVRFRSRALWQACDRVGVS